jgi:gamma-glutamyltranspeptidase/glutathione hydrolase
LAVPNSLAAETGAGPGIVVGETTGEKVGLRVLEDGGNAVDAVVAAALAAAVAAPHQTGIGGYGMCAVVAMDGGKRIVAIDANTAAPAAMTKDAFKPEANGKVPGRVNEHGWLAPGVPGVLAGLQLVLDRFGTRKIGELVQPAITIARDGIEWRQNLADVIGRNPMFQNDAGSRKLFLPNGKALQAGERFKNPELAELLSTLANANSVEAFYRGDIALRIAESFQKNGGLVTAQDLAAYRARIAEPLTLAWGEHAIHTAPLTAGGLSVLQMLRTMQAMNWGKLPDGLTRTQAKIEAMRLAWRDRLTKLGDPEFAKVPIAHLLSDDYARESAHRILEAVKAGKFLAHNVTANGQSGTIHLSAADRDGNFVALTLTHGETFGSCVTVDGLGLTLGAGMSRFDPRPDHPNGPAPRKRPLHNMVPTIVSRGGQPVLAIGGAGGRMIPNALLEVLTQFVVLGQPLAASLAAPRLHTEGNAKLSFEKSWPPAETDEFRKLGYTVTTGGTASMSAVARENSALQKSRR